MKEFKNINDILNFAIENEQNSVDFYQKLAKNSKTENMKTTFEQFAKEEVGHKARLMKIKEEGIFESDGQKIIDLKISDYLISGDINENMTYEQALVLAMKREKSAFKLYLKLAERAPSADLQNIFLKLANDESKHKLRFEIEYDEFVLREN
ncbi:MAG TPA: rubrerythrin [Bacteroidales bacterium]|nr:MAG: rubrerythrin [Bacteroidetes bacterium GWF2_33_38]OFY89609.1 MAG: rubrerythrin [Bacteroidetes bacterium RIFOXYA2_FULL_33_7]HBF87789.1 rubrerythrin [Bacteroidales bacterium]